MEGDIVKCLFTFKVKKAENPKRICNGCALNVVPFGCFSRALCPDDGTGLNLYFEKAEEALAIEAAHDALKAEVERLKAENEALTLLDNSNNQTIEAYAEENARLKAEKYNAPYRVGKKRSLAVLDKYGIEIVVFNKGMEAQAQEYCDFLNSKYL